MTRDERQDLVIDRWKATGCRSTVVANTGFGIIMDNTRLIVIKCI